MKKDFLAKMSHRRDGLTGFGILTLFNWVTLALLFVMNVIMIVGEFVYVYNPGIIEDHSFFMKLYQLPYYVSSLRIPLWGLLILFPICSLVVFFAKLLSRPFGFSRLMSDVLAMILSITGIILVFSLSRLMDDLNTGTVALQVAGTAGVSLGVGALLSPFWGLFAGIGVAVLSSAAEYMLTFYAEIWFVCAWLVAIISLAKILYYFYMIRKSNLKDTPVASDVN